MMNIYDFRSRYARTATRQGRSLNDVTSEPRGVLKGGGNLRPPPYRKTSHSLKERKKLIQGKNMSDNQQPSSASALANSAAGAVREGVAKVTGNPYDAAAADSKKGDSLNYNHLTDH